MMNENGKSDSSIVPEKLPNKAGQPAAEAMEERELAKGKLSRQNACRTQSRIDARSALERVRQAVERDRKQRLTDFDRSAASITRLMRSMLES